jgi:multidrug resistance protein, MATE family
MPIKNSPNEEISYLRVWSLAWPIILSNISIPLIGATNVAVIGRLGSPVYIGAVALGVVVLQCIYWSFAFLRKSTTGITAQAYGAGDKDGVYAALFRSLMIAFLLGIIVICLQVPIAKIAFWLLQGSEEVEALAQEYFHIRIWASVATMSNYVLLGWFYGIQRPKTALAFRVAMNILNIPLAIFLVLTLRWGVAGAAWAAFCSHFFVFILSLTIALYILYKDIKTETGFDLSFLNDLKDKIKLVKIFKLNGDIFVRTILVFLAFSWFTGEGAKQGDALLAANAVLLNLFWFISYALDGFSNAAEALVGQALGANNSKMFDKAVRITTQMAGVFAIIFTIVYAAEAKYFLSLLTTLEEVQILAYDFLPWLIFMPLVGIWCFQIDGIYLGITRTKILRNMMLVSFVVYALAIIFLPKVFGNHGLWLSLHVFMVIRALTLWIPYGKIRKELFN